MQQEERVLTEQIENLQKEKEELTFEILTLEPRASDDETLESEASIGTADSLENLNVDSEEAVSDYSDRNQMGPPSRPRKVTGRVRRVLRRQPESLDSTDSGSTASSYPCPPGASHHLHLRSESPSSDLFRSSRLGSASLGPDRESESRPLYISHGTYSAEKGRLKLKAAKMSPKKLEQKHPEEAGSGGGQDVSQQLRYGSSEFMV